MWPVMDSWIDDENLWIRRTAILCQLKHKSCTDKERLFRYATLQCKEPDFFIRKAIGILKINTPLHTPPPILIGTK